MPNDVIPLPPGEIMGTYNGQPLIRYTAENLHAYAAAVITAARDCRTCSLFYDWEEGVCTQSNKNPCVNGDKHDPLPPVRLWRTT